MTSTAASDDSAPPSFRFDPWVRGWRGPALAALLVFISALPALVFLPPLDRDESRFAQATSQMLETGDYVNIRYQAEPRDKKPVGIHWLQAASVSLLSSVEKREIWAYRVPSLLGAMLAAAACAWGAGRFWGSRGGLIAGAVLGASLLLSSEAFIAKTDAVLSGAVTLAMAALAHLYVAQREGRPLKLVHKTLFWAGMALSILDKGPVGPMVAGLALAALAIVDRRGRWIGKLGWGWGLLLVLAIVGPWALAISVATDGTFWTGAVGGDLAPKLTGGHESHGAPPGYHLLALPLLIFPATALLPAGAYAAWLRRAEPSVRFALAWLIPTWIVFEALPTKLVHYPLPAYGALAWLIAAAVTSPPALIWNRWTRGGGVVLSGLVGVAGALALVTQAPRFGVQTSAWLWLSAGLLLAAGLVGALAVWRRGNWNLLGATLALGTLFHMIGFGGLAPTITRLWVSRAAAEALASRNLDPRNGVTPGPVAIAGYAEPSLVFLLGTSTDLGTPEDAADAISDGEPALVEAKQDAAFRLALKAAGASATVVDEIKGLDYSIGKPVDIRVYRSDVPTVKDDGEDSAPPSPKTVTRPAP
jgi:4-amino-4-deoxy-L-arabinose transferase-like glycosyltransferase